MALFIAFISSLKAETFQNFSLITWTQSCVINDNTFATLFNLISLKVLSYTREGGYLTFFRISAEIRVSSET